MTPLQSPLALPFSMPIAFPVVMPITKLGADPLSGHLFVFRSRRGDRLKMLYWDEDGLVVWAKRLEEGTFQLPAADAVGVEIKATDLALILGGVDLHSAKRRRRYRRPATV